MRQAVRCVLGAVIMLGSAGLSWSGLWALEQFTLDGAPDSAVQYDAGAIEAELPDTLWASVHNLSDAYRQVLELAPWEGGSESRVQARVVNQGISEATHCLFEAFAEYRIRGGDTPLTAGEVSHRLERTVFAGSRAKAHYDSFNGAVSGSVWALPKSGVECR